jgi:undecaprenyl-diphosphatase
VTLIEILQYYDTLLFQFLNHLIAHPLWDGAMVVITTKKYWTMPLVAVWLLLIWRGGIRGRAAAVILLLAVGSADWISARIIKPEAGRLRPCHELENVRLLVSCGGKYGFPSSHAANTFAAAVTLAFFYRRYAAFFVGLSVLVGYSRIVVGVHYPGDVLGGFALGSIVAIIFLILYQKLEGIYPGRFKKG